MLYSLNYEIDMYHKIAILSTSPCFEISSQKGCLFSRGAWGANKCIEFSGSVQLCGNRLAVTYFSPRVSFSAIFCPMFIAFLQPEIQSTID